jgi:hypothetical protein
MSKKNNLIAPTFFYLHNLPSTEYCARKTARGANLRIPEMLQNADAQEIVAELAWVESVLETTAMEEETKRRKKQEEEDEEAARELNYQEHQVNGGLLEWSLPKTLALLILVVVVLMNVL